MKAYTKEKRQQFDKWWQQVSKRVEISDVDGPARPWPPKWEELPKFPVGLWTPTEEQIQGILKKLVDLALSLGAVEATAIPTKEIPVDIRTLYVGCLFPDCRWQNTNMFCPMKLTLPFEEMEEMVKSDYDNAIVFKVLPPKFDSLPDVGEINLDAYYNLGGRPAPDKAMLARNIIRLRILDEITRRIRQVAYYDGCLSSIPLGNGPCIVSKCASWGTCSALKTGGVCRFRGVSPNSPIAYADYHTLARNLGWGQLQVRGNCAHFPEEVPDPEGYYNIGMVLVD